MQNETTTQQQTVNTAAEGSFAIKEELQLFYKQGLPAILKSIFLQPADGVYRLFTNLTEKAFINGLVLMGAAFLLYTLVPYLLVGSEVRRYIGFTTFLQLGFSILVFLFLLSTVCFGLKATNSKPSFKKDLITGGICAVPVITLLVLAVLAKLFTGGSNPLAGMYGLLRLFSLSSATGMLFLLPTLICFLLLINIVFQTLKAGNVTNTLAWYLSPVCIAVSCFLTVKITEAIF